MQLPKLYWAHEGQDGEQEVTTESQTTEPVWPIEQSRSVALQVLWPVQDTQTNLLQRADAVQSDLRLAPSPEVVASCGAAVQIHALIEHANAKRIREGFQEARNLLEEARELLGEFGDAFLLARCDMYEAALAADDRRLGTACGLLESAVSAFLDLGEIHLAG
jgi:hypothetical protein